MLWLFFASGFVALLYQVIWQRLLGLVTGLDLYAVTLVVAVFMAGMGGGSYAGGALTDRLSTRALLGVFAVAEAVVAGFALVSKTLYHDLLYGLAATSTVPAAALAALAAATLLVPTFCMGLTLPVLSQALTASVEDAPRRVAALYGWNTLGAAMGAWLGSGVFIRSVGYERSLWLGALVNIGCALSVLAWLSRRGGAQSQPTGWRLEHVTNAADANHSGSRSTDGAPRGTRWPWPVWLAAYALSGCIALGLEMVWFRLLGVVLKSTAYTFPLLLGFYLLGVGGGSLLGRLAARRTSRPLTWFLALQAAIPLYAGLSVGALLWGLRTQPALAPMQNYLASYEPIDFAFNFERLTVSQLGFYTVLPALLILVPTCLMGVSFPLLQRGLQTDLARVGRRVGLLQTANIVGATTGVLLVGLVLIDRMGTPGTLRVLMAGGAVYLTMAVIDLLGGTQPMWRAMAATAATALALWGVRAVPGPAVFWGRFHGVPPERVIHAEDATGLAVLTSPDPFFRRRADVFVNGLGQSTIPFGGIHTYLGLVPALLHPAPRRVAVIGLGSGDTAYAAGLRRETEALHCVEIIGGQVRTLRELHQRTGYPGLGQLLADPRLHLVIGDGRRYLMRSDERFDIIEADALRPGSAYAGHLYSREYFELLRSRLDEGGLAVTWAPTPRIEWTFTQVFPYVAAVPPMLIGSNTQIAFDREAIQDRASEPYVVAHFTRAGLSLDEYLAQLLSTFEHRQPSSVPANQSMLNTDLFPRDELRTPMPELQD